MAIKTLKRNKASINSVISCTYFQTYQRLSLYCGEIRQENTSVLFMKLNLFNLLLFFLGLNFFIMSIVLFWYFIILSYGEGNGNPFQYFCLENPMDRGAWCFLLAVLTGKSPNNLLHTNSFIPCNVVSDKVLFHVIKCFL